jgi:hypothetical protein
MAAERDHVILELDGREARFSSRPPHFPKQRGELKRVQPSKAKRG